MSKFIKYWPAIISIIIVSFVFGAVFVEYHDCDGILVKTLLWVACMETR